MAEREFARAQMLLGEAAMDRLAASTVAVYGLGGVGGTAAEALARSGVGRLILIDSDCVDITNLNRQVIALHSTVGKRKVDVMRARILDINPAAQVECRAEFHLPGMPLGYLDGCNAVADAIDTVSAKLDIAAYCTQHKIPLVSAMGAGNRTDPSRLRAADIYKTAGCPLCRVMRRELRSRGVPALRVIWSDEPALVPADAAQDEAHPSRHTPGSLAFVPPAMGLLLAREIVCELLGGFGAEQAGR